MLMKKIFDNRFLFLVFCNLFTGVFLYGQETSYKEFNKMFPKRELRGVFVASIYNLNWPKNPNSTPEVQKAELISIFEKLKKNGYNTVFLQVRGECDALYNSQIEPWSYRLTGRQGKAPNPFWDPLEFAIKEAHTRGLDLHAWLNPYRASANVKSYPIADSHIIKRKPEWVFSASNIFNLKILNPGLKEVRDYITEVVKDISTRYDVDGIHFDDYFYPDAGMKLNQDKMTFKQNNPDSIASIEDWRRDNVNKMIAQVYDAIQVVNKKLNKNIVFGVSPIGIWKSGTPEGTFGNPSFSALFCDPIAWLEQEKVDYLAPQIYWRIGGRQDYMKVSSWWDEQISKKNKHLYVSQVYYRMVDESNWSNKELIKQVRYNRSDTLKVTFGQIAYNFNSIEKNHKKINEVFLDSVYKYKTFAPPISKLDSIQPNKPLNVTFDGEVLKWKTPEIATDGDLPVKYVVYAFDSPQEISTNQNDGTKIIDIVVSNEFVVNDDNLKSKYFVITSLDDNNNESSGFEEFVCLDAKVK